MECSYTSLQGHNNTVGSWQRLTWGETAQPLLSIAAAVRWIQIELVSTVQCWG